MLGLYKLHIAFRPKIKVYKYSSIIIQKVRVTIYDYVAHYILFTTILSHL